MTSVEVLDRKILISRKLHTSDGFISVALVKIKVLTRFLQNKMLIMNTYDGHITNVPSGCRHYSFSQSLGRPMN